MLSLNFPEYKDYKFGDSISSYDSSDNGYYTGKTGNLDFKGKYKIDLDLRPLEIKEKIDSPELEFKMSNSYSLDFETTIKDVDEKTVTNRSSVNVFNGKILPGIKIISPTYQKVNSKFIFDLLSVNHSGKPVPSELDIRVIQTNWNSIATKASGNATQNKNTEIKKLVHREVIRTGSSPYRFTYKPSGTGNFTLTVQLKHGVSYGKTSFYSYDEKSPYNKWYHSSDSRMEVSSEKNIYSPGDTAKILVKSPFPKARAVISVEREKVLWQQTLNLENTSVPIEIPIKPEYIPNVSVKVAFFSPRSFYPKENQVEQYSLDQKDIGVPEFKLGKVNLKIESSSKILPISITLDKLQYVPQEEVTMTISSAPNTEVSLSVADEAVLNLIGYGYSNPVVEIYDSWGEGVYMMENRRYLIHQLSKAMKGANPGGDFYNPQEGSGGFYLDSEEGRKNIKYTAYQNPLIKLGISGTQKIKFKLPDNITSFKIMAIASNNGSYGIENHSFKVRKSVVVQKSVPAFIRPGDNLLVGGIVINQTGFDMKFKVSYKTNLLKIEGKDTEEIFLKEGERKEVAFKVQLDETKFKDYKKNKHKGKHSVFFPGEVESWIEVVPSGKIDSIAKKANRMVSDYSDKLFIKFPIKTETPQESIVISGSSKGNINEKVKIPSKKEILQDVGEIEFGLSNTALIGLEKAFQYYAANPYFCAEQRSSAFLLRMSAGELLKEFSVPVPKGEGYDFSVIDKLFLEEIGEFQNSDGGFRLWKKGTEGDNPYLSVYVAYVLQAARKQGFKADETVYKNSLKYVNNLLTKNADEEISYLLDTLSLASYILSNEGEIVRNVNDFIYNNRNHLSLRARAFLLMAFSGNKSQEELKNDAAVNTLLKEILTRLEEKDGHISTIEEYSLYSSRSYYNSGVALGNVLQALIKVDPRNAIIPKIVKTIVESKKRNIWESTSSSGNLALGLKEYRDNYEIKGFEPFSLKTALNSNLLGEIGFAKKEPFTQKQTFQLFDLDSRFNLFSGEELNFSINGVGNYYYNLKTSFTKLSSIKPQDNGIEIHRHIYDPDVNNLSEIYNLKQKNEYQRGKIYFVRLVVYSEKDVYNLVIEDPIPSNMEIVNTAFLTENSEFKKLEARQKYSSEEGMLIEKREDRYLITQDSFASGQREYFYLLRPIIKGTSFVPAPKAKMMYQNSVNGRGAEKIFSVK